MKAKNIESIAPLSAQQQGMFLETLAAEEPGVHVEQDAYLIRGKLEIPAFERAWQSTVDRHSILRTAFSWKHQDEPYQVAFRRLKVSMEHQDWRDVPSGEQRERLDQFLLSDRRRGFDFSIAPLMRLALFALTDDTHQLVWSKHHLIIDGWSVPVILKDVAAFYDSYRNGREARVESACPYRDYVVWAGKQDLGAAERYWRKALEGFALPTPLGRSGPAASARLEQAYGTRTVRLTADATSDLQAFARQNHVTLNILIQAVWALLLARYGDRDDILYGTTVSGRPPELPGVESIVGPFLNTLPFRVRVDRRKSLREWLKSIQRTHLEVRSYEYCSMGQIHQWSEVAGSLPLCESILVFENYPVDEEGASGDRDFDIRPIRSDGARTRYPLTILVDGDLELRVRFVYDCARLAPEEVDRVSQHFRSLLIDLPARSARRLGEILDEIPGSEIPRVSPRAEPGADGSGRAFAPPSTMTEARLARIWSELLGVERVGRDDSLLERGGHSLIAMRLMARLRTEFSVDLPLNVFFEEPTLSKMAARIDRAAGGPGERSNAAAQWPVRPKGPVALSFGQERLWFLDQLEPGSRAYGVHRGFRIRGDLNVAALGRSLDRILERHEALRTRFAERDGILSQIVMAAGAAPFSFADLRELAEGARDAKVSEMIREEVERPFDLANGPLWRALLLRLSDDEHLLLLAIHHIVSDGWSLGIFFRELGTLYSAISAGSVARLPELSVQYPDYALWQREWLTGPRLEELLTYWRDRLAGAPPVLTLPTGRPRPAEPSFRGRFQAKILPSEVTRDLQTLARSEGVTAFTVLLAVFQALLARRTGREDIVVGTDTANRTRVETEPLIGFFVNLLPVRTDLSGNPTFRDLLSRAREAAVGAYAHQDLPFEKLVEELQPSRMLGINPLVQILIVQAPPSDMPELRGLSVEPLPITDERSRFDLVLFVSERKEGLRTGWLYNADLFDAGEIGALAADFESLLAGALANPEARLDSLKLRPEGETEERSMENKERQEAPASRLRRARRKGVDISRAADVAFDSLASGQSLPLLIRPVRPGELDLADWTRSHREVLEEKLLEHGAILFRGFDVTSAGEFERFAAGLCRGELFGEYGDLPREAMGGKVYGSTPYPSDQPILFHNESSHMHRWPMKIWFFCVTAAKSGGETPIVDCRAVYRRLDPQLRQRFSEKGLLYVRNYTEGLDVSWQSFYGTDDRGRVEELCRRAGVEFEWTGGNGLRTRQKCPAIVRHPQTDEMAFFNQLQLHHVSCLDPAVRESLSSLMREEDFPRNVFYGDGSRIEDSAMEEISGIYQEEAVAFPWLAEDILMVNNMLVAHSRNPYVGARKILVAMGDMVDQNEVPA